MSVSIEALEAPEISEALIKVPADEVKRFFSENKLQMADTTYGKSRFFRLSLLIGSDFYWKVVTGKICRLSESLVASETVFGWVVNGGNIQKDAEVVSSSVSIMKAALKSSRSEESVETNAVLKTFGT